MGFLEVATLAVSAIGMLKQHEAAEDQAYAMKQQSAQQAEATRQQTAALQESEAAKGRAAAVEAQRQRVAALREQRRLRSMVVAKAGNAGLGAGTSGTLGAVSSVGSQTGDNIGFINQQETFAEQASQANQRAADASSAFTLAGVQGQVRMAQAQADGAMWGKVGSMAYSIFDKKDGWGTIFGKKDIPKVS